MFTKCYRMKTNTALKNSEKKHLAQRIQQEFPSISDDRLRELVPNKSQANCMKIMTSLGDILCIYSIDNVPIIIEAHDKFYPTVHALWKVPEVLPTITIHEPIVAKLKTGVPIYVPGVVVPSQGRGFPLFSLGATIAVNSDTNCAAAAVGKAVMSSAQILMSNSGVCIEVIHVLGDFLCREEKFRRLERPELGSASYGQEQVTECITVNLEQIVITPSKVKEEWPLLGCPAAHSATWIRPGQNEVNSELNTEIIVSDISSEKSNLSAEQNEIDDGFPPDMDGLLRFCLLSFLKLDGKKTVLPLRTNLLYRNHMVPLCPPSRALDLKKSTYKKMSKFIEAMHNEGLIQVKMIEKGVDAVTSINLSHPSVRAHYVPEIVLTKVEEANREPDDPDAYVAPIVREMFSITANIQDLFAPLKKGTLVTAADIRSTVTDYVQRHKLQSETQPGLVQVNNVLAKISGKDGLISWEELNAAVQGKMTACTEMRFADGTIKTNKSRLDPIKMSVATRSGNKKVTLVSNLEAFGFSLPALGKACQHGLSVSSTITRTAGSKYDQLMVQGDQMYFITKMLLEKYHIPKKFIDGADKMLKKRK